MLLRRGTVVTSPRGVRLWLLPDKSKARSAGAPRLPMFLQRRTIVTSQKGVRFQFLPHMSTARAAGTQQNLIHSIAFRYPALSGDASLGEERGTQSDK